MRRTIFYLALGLLILGCKIEPKKTNTEDSSETQETSTVETSKIGRTNYAAVWKWTTTDEKLVAENTVQIGEELNALWKKDVVENVYYNSNAKVDKLGFLPNIAFFIKAHTVQEARATLNDLTIVKKGLAAYTLHPVGNLWLERKELKDKELTLSFVSVWTTTGKPSAELTKAQNDKILELWNEGKIENVYFDIEGTQKANDKTDFVFYVNTNSEEEARALCNSLPMYKENMATYELHSVGVFFMGKYAND